MKNFLCCLFLLGLLSSFHPASTAYETESACILRVVPYANGKYAPLNRYLNADSLIFTKIKIYVSDVEFVDSKMKNQGMHHVFEPKLFSPEDSMYAKFTLDFGWDFEPDSLYLTLGMDSLCQTNKPMQGDLDPIHGMYWTWHSGFVHIKVEGSLRGKSFEYHLGGYQGDFASAQKLAFPLHNLIREYDLRIHLDPLLEYIDTNPTIMSAGEESKMLMEKLAKSIELEP